MVPICRFLAVTQGLQRRSAGRDRRRPLAASDVAPTYAEGVNIHSDPGFDVLASRLEAVLDAHAFDTPSVRDNTRQATELEYRFFDASL